MPLKSQPKTIEHIWGNLYIKLFPHPDDLAQLAANKGKIPEDYVPKSTFSFAYGEYNSDEDYAKIGSNEQVEPNRLSGEATITGNLVRPIVENIAFHTMASQLIAKVIKGDVTEGEMSGVREIETVRSSMKGATADFQFGTTPFTISE